MARFAFYKTFEKDALADGAKWDESWVADADYIIKRIHVARKDGASFTDSLFYWKIEEVVYTKPSVPCIVLGPDVLVTPELNVELKNKQKISWTLHNREGASIDVMLYFELWHP